MSKRQELAKLDQQFDTYTAVLQIVIETIRQVNNNPELLAFLLALKLRIEAELLDLAIKRTFPDYVPKWKRDQK